jgi:PKD repeat protein
MLKLKTAIHPTATQKATATVTAGIGITTIAGIISAFILYTEGMPLTTRICLAVAAVIIAIVILIAMYYTNKKYGIDWMAIIGYIIQLIDEIQHDLEDNKPNPDPDPVVTPPTADFTVTTAAGPLPQTAAFKDASTGATAWSWAFGDGATAVVKDPTHAYSMYGDYDATLTVSNSAGSATAKKTVSIREPQLAPGVQYAQWNGNTVVFILVPVWRNGGGKVVRDDCQDSSKWYPIVYKNSETDALKLCQRGYYEVATNTVYSIVDDPFAQPETKVDVQNKMDAAEQPMEYLMQWFAAKRSDVDINLLKCQLILPQNVIDGMKSGDGSAYRDYVAGLPLQPDGQPGGLIYAYANWLKNHDHAAQMAAANAYLDAYF